MRIYIQCQGAWAGCEWPCLGSRSQPAQPCRARPLPALVCSGAISPGRNFPFCSELLPDIEANTCKASLMFPLCAVTYLQEKSVPFTPFWSIPLHQWEEHGSCERMSRARAKGKVGWSYLPQTATLVRARFLPLFSWALISIFQHLQGVRSTDWSECFCTLSFL